MQAAGEPVEDLALRGELAGFGVRGAARIGEAGGDVLVAVEIRQVLRVGDEGDDHLPPFLAGADRHYLHPVVAAARRRK